MLVAESLRRVPEPLEAALAPLPCDDPAAVVRAIARALLPPEAADPPPAWLRPEQVEAFRRAVAATRRFGGALIAEPVGTGKTWISAAAAVAVDPAPPLVIAPAVLLPQWRRVLIHLGLPATVHSHEALSRGRLPEHAARVAIIDESHWFRNPATRRYRTLAPWLSGRRGILLTATPVVNQAADIGHQLRLVLRDDALISAGLPSLRGISEAQSGIEALGEVVVAGGAIAAVRPPLVRSTERVRLDRRLGRILRELDRLGLATDPAIAALVRTSLWSAAASSPAALDAALLRYLTLLDHAADAAREGRRLGRDALRRFLAPDPTQLVLWELLPPEEAGGAELILTDRVRVAALRDEAARLAEQCDGKADRLKHLLADGRRTVIFTGAVATVSYLRRLLGPEPVAWCTGATAGIGATRLPRETVLAWFAPGAAARATGGVRIPRWLVTTDVAAEGLDLQGAERVVHYDLPWTVIRTDQRIGRVHRLHSAHGEVAEHWLLPSRTIARRLRIERILAGKRLLPGRLGIGENAATSWRRRYAVARALAGEPAVEGVALAQCPSRGEADAIAAVRVENGDGCGATRLFVHHPRRGWRPDDSAGLEWLRLLAGAAPATPPEWQRFAALVETLALPVREMVRRSTGLTWQPGWMAPGSLTIMRRLRQWARIAARARDARLLERLDTAVRGLGRGRTAGEELILAQLAGQEEASLHEHLRLLPAGAPPLPLPVVRLVGMVVWQWGKE